MEWVVRPLLTIGGAQISLVKLFQFLVAVVVVVVLARMIGRLVGSRLLRRTGMSPGLQYALERITYYLLIALGLTVALQTSGIEVGSLMVVLGGLGVGIGFGLQNIVNNFVSGLILLAERPIQPGDWIEVGGKSGRVTRIGG
jgi:small-conductance mechanosensitive channel